MDSFMSEFSGRVKGLGVIWKDVVALSVKMKRKFGPYLSKIKELTSGKKSPLWKFYRRVENDPCIVECTVCYREIRRGRPGAPKSEFYNRGMQNHIERMHTDIWSNALIELTEQHKYQKQLDDCKTKYEKKKALHKASKLWQYFEESCGVATCQVGDCTAEVAQGGGGQWREEDLRLHLVEHGYVEE